MNCMYRCCHCYWYLRVASVIGTTQFVHRFILAGTAETASPYCEILRVSPDQNAPCRCPVAVEFGKCRVFTVFWLRNLKWDRRIVVHVALVSLETKIPKDPAAFVKLPIISKEFLRIHSAVIWARVNQHLI
ncbi:Hypothetical protein CINCED_3A019646 [Cinara cedri]|uniref:Uncharacterized protein n=1 Tax=Cinara cedri TaxID=506608 RepID=A0A5E4MID6_9HEMI|nr:Hypothetical protein CINCED_3A019646 [Cinara cedri]